MKKILASLIFVLLISCQISAQSILKNGKIPKDLIITLDLSGTIQFANYYTYKIISDRKVFYEEQLNLPPQKSFSDFLLKGQKPPKLKDKLSKKHLKQIIAEFEESGFWQIPESNQCQPAVNHYTTKGISITLNGTTKRMNAIDLQCNSDQNSSLKSFLNLYDKIAKELSGVKKKTKLTK